MKISFEILTFILKDNIVFDEINSLNCSLSGIRLYPSGRYLRKDVLYIADLRDGQFFKNNRPLIENIYDFPLNILFLTSKKHVDEKGLHLACSMYAELKAGDNYAVMESGWDSEEVLTKLEGTMHDLNEWDASFDKGILTKKDNEELFSSGRKYLPYRYGIFDRDMRVIYDTYYKPGVKNGPAQDVSKDIFNELILHKDFHEAASYTEPFYYKVAYTGDLDYCYNFFVNNEYMARLLIILPHGIEDLHEGAKELFLVFAGHIQDIFDNGNYVFGRHSDDRMHQLLKALAGGESIAPETIRAHLKVYGWSENSIFTVAAVRFYSEEGWGSKIETSLPYLAMHFEKEFRDSCTVIDGREIIMLIDHGPEGKNYDKRAFLSRIAELVRDNVCRAGISPEFTGLNKTHSALMCARYAINIGIRLKPHFWYYLFDDIRLEYIAGRCKSEISEDFVCHSALNILEKYDADHKSELYLTLKTLIGHNLNVSAAADSICVHRTTFMRRIDKICELTGADLEDPDTVLLLALSYKIKETI